MILSGHTWKNHMPILKTCLSVTTKTHTAFIIGFTNTRLGFCSIGLTHCLFYTLHCFDITLQELARHECRRKLQKGQAILELDYAAKMTLFSQDAMPCSAAKQTSNFIVFAHFNPQQNADGRNITDTTEVFAFHSDCTKQDTHSIRRCVTHVIENLKHRGFLRTTLHIWADGSGAQNKGRKSFRQMSELSMEMGINIIDNFACSHHFAGPWDTEGGRQHRSITLHVRNDRTVKDCEAILGAADNVSLLRRIMKKAGPPDPPITSQNLWRCMHHVRS